MNLNPFISYKIYTLSTKKQHSITTPRHCTLPFHVLREQSFNINTIGTTFLAESQLFYLLYLHYTKSEHQRRYIVHMK